jgi:hypothetical protein
VGIQSFPREKFAVTALAELIVLFLNVTVPKLDWPEPLVADAACNAVLVQVMSEKA